MDREGWLADIMDDASIRYKMHHEPQSKDVRPIDRREAFKLFVMMDKRFEEWTGIPLGDFVTNSG